MWTRESNDDWKKLSRGQIVTLLEEKMAEIAHLNEQADEMKKQLDDRRIKIDSCGSLSEACLAVNDVVATVQKAADQYIENAKVICNERIAKSETLLADTEVFCKDRIAEMESRCAEMLSDAEQSCEQLKARVGKEAESLKAEAERYHQE